MSMKVRTLGTLSSEESQRPAISEVYWRMRASNHLIRHAENPFHFHLSTPFSSYLFSPFSYSLFPPTPPQSKSFMNAATLASSSSSSSSAITPTAIACATTSPSSSARVGGGNSEAVGRLSEPNRAEPKGAAAGEK